MLNFSENLSIKSGGEYLVIERRQPVIPSDTIFYYLTGVRHRETVFTFITSGMEENKMQGFVEDTYLHTKTPLKSEGITNLDFSVTRYSGFSRR